MLALLAVSARSAAQRDVQCSGQVGNTPGTGSCAPLVSAVQGISFGALLPGVPTLVSPMDVVRAARLIIDGTLGQSLSVTWILPAAMTSANGARLPVSFLVGDATYSPTAGTADVMLYDPTRPFSVVGGRHGALTLGGRALPSASQPSGKYVGQVTVQVTYTGL